MKLRILTVSLMMAALSAQAQVKLGISEQVRLRELRTELRQTDVFQFKKNTSQRAKELIGVNPSHALAIVQMAEGTTEEDLKAQGVNVIRSRSGFAFIAVPLDEVTPEMRRTAKTANFGIMYGISAFGLAQRLKVPRVAAKKIIEDYFTNFPKISQWIDRTVEDARRRGYVQTLCGRRRYLPEINSRNQNVRSLAERNAVNAPIQGTAADIIKMAMIRVDQKIRQRGLKSKMVLQIHDELLFEAPRSELESLMDIIKQEMENVLQLSVPLTVECNYGENWLEAH